MTVAGNDADLRLARGVHGCNDSLTVSNDSGTSYGTIHGADHSVCIDSWFNISAIHLLDMH
eukprot:276896-Amphidinium_carterae.1